MLGHMWRAANYQLDFAAAIQLSDAENSKMDKDTVIRQKLH